VGGCLSSPGPHRTFGSLRGWARHGGGPRRETRRDEIPRAVLPASHRVRRGEGGRGVVDERAEVKSITRPKLKHGVLHVVKKKGSRRRRKRKLARAEIKKSLTIKLTPHRSNYRFDIRSCAGSPGDRGSSSPSAESCLNASGWERPRLERLLHESQTPSRKDSA
jgi:hypothetical protein